MAGRRRLIQLRWMIHFMTKFRELMVGDRFKRVPPYGLGKDNSVYIKIANKEGLFSECEVAHEEDYPTNVIDVGLDDKVEKLEPTLPPKVAKRTITFLKENLSIQLRSKRTYDGEGFTVELKLCDEVISSDTFIFEYGD